MFRSANIANCHPRNKSLVQTGMLPYCLLRAKSKGHSSRIDRSSN